LVRFYSAHSEHPGNVIEGYSISPGAHRRNESEVRGIASAAGIVSLIPENLGSRSTAEKIVYEGVV
jgi:hypothetical protein